MNRVCRVESDIRNEFDLSYLPLLRYTRRRRSPRFPLAAEHLWATPAVLPLYLFFITSHTPPSDILPVLVPSPLMPSLARVIKFLEVDRPEGQSSFLVNHDLLPVPEHERLWKNWHFVTFWLVSCASPATVAGNLGRQLQPVADAILAVPIADQSCVAVHV